MLIWKVLIYLKNTYYVHWSKIVEEVVLSLLHTVAAIFAARALNRIHTLQVDLK